MHITDGVNICLYVCVSESIGPCVSCVCLSVCGVSNQITNKNHVIYVKHTATAGIMVLRLDKFRSMILLSKITH